MTYDIMFVSGKLFFDKCIKYENFDKKEPVTNWEKNSTLDC